MLSLGLSHADLLAFQAGLASDHRVRIRGELLDMNHNVVGVLTGRVTGGQVDWAPIRDDSGQCAAAPRTATVQVHDPGDLLNLGTANGPTSASFYADRMVRLSYEVKSEQHDSWVSTPLITGPIMKASRTGEGEVELEVSDKAALLLGPQNHSKTYPKGTRVTDALTDMLQRTGERFYDIATSGVRLTKPFVESSTSTIWQQIQDMSRALGDWRVAYDGRGYMVVRPRYGLPVISIAGGTGGMLLAPPQLTFDLSKVVNMVQVTGGTPDGAKGIASATVYAPATSPFNGNALGRNGVPRWIRATVQDDTITSSAAALARANSELNNALSAAAQVSVDCLVVQHLEPGDAVTVHAPQWTWSFTVESATIPLDGTGKMTLGRNYVVRNVSRPRSMPRRGTAFKAVTTNPVKPKPVAKVATKGKAASSKGKTTHKSTPTKHR